MECERLEFVEEKPSDQWIEYYSDRNVTPWNKANEIARRILAVFLTPGIFRAGEQGETSEGLRGWITG